MTNDNKSIFVVLSLPRSGSSAFSKILTELGVVPFSTNAGINSNAWEFNTAGYFEDTGISLLCDQLIRLVGVSKRKSFLNPPIYSDISKLNELELLDKNFWYDITSESVQIPDDFEENLMAYTGNDWDQWGLTRMREGGKWFNCYSKIGVDKYEGIKERICEIRQMLTMSEGPVFIKDPRLAFTLHLFGLTNIKFLWVRREPNEVKSSMRRHYGPRLFTEVNYSGFDWVSNHFNYQVPGQDFNEYIANYEKWIESQIGDHSVLKFQLNEVGNHDFQHELKAFLGE